MLTLRDSEFDAEAPFQHDLLRFLNILSALSRYLHNKVRLSMAQREHVMREIVVKSFQQCFKQMGLARLLLLREAIMGKHSGICGRLLRGLQGAKAIMEDSTMKRALACAMIVGLFASTASALSAGPGAIIYSSIGTSASSRWTGVQLYRTTVDTAWAATQVGYNFDCITFVARAGTLYGGTPNRVEVWDPRITGGQGDLALVATVTTYNSTSDEHNPYDVVRVDADTPANNKTWTTGLTGNILMLRCGGPWAGGSGTTEVATTALRTSANWGGKTTNGIGIALNGGSLSYRYDANGNGWCDNNVTAPLEYVMTTTAYGSYPSDQEFGIDGAVYVGYSSSSGGTGGIQRYTNTGSAFTATTFATVGGAGNPMGTTTDASSNLGVAVGGTSNRAIVYAAANDDCGAMSIFALVDGNGDGQALWSDSNDKVIRLWKSGQLGVSQGTVWDLEYLKDGNNQQWLLFSGGSALNGLYSLYAMQLGDNGLVAVNGMKIADGAAGRFFEVDADPVPEPATLLLVGTGAISLLGAIRRKRMR
jgi:hypothetical protein